MFVKKSLHWSRKYFYIIKMTHITLNEHLFFTYVKLIFIAAYSGVRLSSGVFMGFQDGSRSQQLALIYHSTELITLSAFTNHVVPLFQVLL